MTDWMNETYDSQGSAEGEGKVDQQFQWRGQHKQTRMCGSREPSGGPQTNTPTCWNPVEQIVFQKESIVLLIRSSPNNTTQLSPCARPFWISLALQITRQTDYWQQKGTQHILKRGSATTVPWIQSAFNLIANAVTSCHRLSQRPEPAPYFWHAY